MTKPNHSNSREPRPTPPLPVQRRMAISIQKSHLSLWALLWTLLLVSPQSTFADQTIGFEQVEPGSFKTLETELGTWTTQAGTTIVDHRHAKTGDQCLRLTGGEQCSVVLTLKTPLQSSSQLSFWAERWTQRSPFAFRIGVENDGRWQEIYNGDRDVRVGRAFLNHIRVPLEATPIKQLRFACSSPNETGVMIDDVRIAQAQPQEISNVEVVPFTLPALVGTAASPLAKLVITTQGNLNPISLTQLNASLIGQEKLSSVELGITGQSDRIRLSMPSTSATITTWNPSIMLQEGENIVWLKGTLRNLTRIDGSVGATLHQIAFSNGEVLPLTASPATQRVGIALRQAGEDGVHTYRIPGLATTNAGTLIGVYDVRRRSGGDLPGDIDVGMSRSTDGGHTWEPMRTIMDMGKDPHWRYDGIGDPAILVDNNTGTIWVAATWSHGNRSWHGSGPGLTPEETGQVMLVRSDDDGVSWSEPINITRQIKKPEWCFILQGPGKGITMRDGTLVFAAQYQDPPDRQRLPHSTIIYSKNHGETWQIGTGAFDDTTEAQVVEVEPGVLMLNCRYNRGDVRVVMTTQDMGQTWHEHPTSRRALIEPRSCMASMIDINQELGTDAGGWLLFSNPNSTSGRNHITIKASRDRGLTWPEQFQLLLDEGNSAGYSCLSMIDEQTVGILYEGSQSHLTFQRISLQSFIGE